ncbi:MAG TPA: hypothetical protein VL087_01665 [Nitrospirota bacterium]|nr:hypothetical protein [Nitrospirota bacterium]
MNRISSNTREISLDALHHEQGDTMVRISENEHSPCPVPKNIARQDP